MHWHFFPELHPQLAALSDMAIWGGGGKAAWGQPNERREGQGRKGKGEEMQFSSDYRSLSLSFPIVSVEKSFMALHVSEDLAHAPGSSSRGLLGSNSGGAGSPHHLAPLVNSPAPPVLDPMPDHLRPLIVSSTNSTPPQASTPPASLPGTHVATTSTPLEEKQSAGAGAGAGDRVSASAGAGAGMRKQVVIIDRRDPQPPAAAGGAGDVRPPAYTPGTAPPPLTAATANTTPWQASTPLRPLQALTPAQLQHQHKHRQPKEEQEQVVFDPIDGTARKDWQPPIWVKLINEFVGTLFLCLTVSVNAGQATVQAAFSVGAVLMVMVFAGGHLSGAHYNPACTLAILLSGKCKLLDAVLYVVAQVAGSFCAGGISLGLIDIHQPRNTTTTTAGTMEEAATGNGATSKAMPSKAMQPNKQQGVIKITSYGYPAVADGLEAHSGATFACEAIYTAALCLCVLHTACTKAQSNNSYFGLAIGMTVTAGAIAVGGITGGAFNPAVGMLPLVKGAADDVSTPGGLRVHCETATHACVCRLRGEETSMLRTACSKVFALTKLTRCFVRLYFPNHLLFLAPLLQIWLYWAGPLAGAVFAALVFRVTGFAEFYSPGSQAREVAENCAPFLMEFVGTFYLCFTVALSLATTNSSTLGSLSIGLILMVMVYTGGSVSGGNFNPAVTLALWLRQAPGTSVLHVIGYVVSQVAGSFAAAGAAVAIVGSPALNGTHGYPTPTFENDIAISGELLGTFALVHVVLNVATTHANIHNSHFGLSIGFTVFSMAVAFGGITGCALNPAVGTGLVVFAKAESEISVIWVYWAGPLAGAALAALVFRISHASDQEGQQRSYQLHAPAGHAEKEFNRHMPRHAPGQTHLPEFGKRRPVAAWSGGGRPSSIRPQGGGGGGGGGMEGGVVGDGAGN